MWLSISSPCSTHDPEPVKPGFLNDDQRHVLSLAGAGFGPELGKARQQPGNVTAAQLMLRHLFAAWHQCGDQASRAAQFK